MNNQIPNNPNIEVLKAKTNGLFTNYIYKAIPLAFDESMSYYETLCGLLNYLKNTIIPTVNNNADAVSELQNLYVELKNYVDNYFTNLDVQEEINNKLDEMVKDGTFDTIINDTLFNELNEKVNKNSINADIYAIYRGQNEGDCYLIKTDNKNILIDLGVVTGIPNLITWLGANNIFKIDYVIITHYDVDHIANVTGLTNLINSNINIKDATFLLPPLLDFSKTVGDTTVYQNLQNSFINILNENNIAIQHLTENQEISLNNDNKLKFYNLNPSYYDEYYTITENDAGISGTSTNFNNFSVVTLLTSCENKILFTGDIQKPAEANLVNIIKNIDVLEMPHHGVNVITDENFKYNLFPKIAMMCNTVNTLVGRSLYTYLKQVNTKIYTTNESGTIHITSKNKKIDIETIDGIQSSPINTAILNNDDLDNFVHNGSYFYSGLYTLQNSPVANAISFRLDVIEIENTRCYQYLYANAVDQLVYTRHRHGGGWSQWQRLNYLDTNIVKNALDNPFTLSTTLTTIPFTKVLLARGNDIENNDGVFTFNGGYGLARITVNVTIVGGLNKGDRLRLIIMKNGERLAYYDFIFTGEVNQSWCTLQLANVLAIINNNDTIEVQIQNLTENNGVIDTGNASTYLQIEYGN